MVNGVKNVIGYVRNVDWVKQTSIWSVVRQDGVQVGRTVLTGVLNAVFFFFNHNYQENFFCFFISLSFGGVVS